MILGRFGATREEGEGVKCKPEAGNEKWGQTGRGAAHKMRGCSPGPLGALFLFTRLVLLGPLLCLGSCLQTSQLGQLFPNWVPQSTGHKALPEDVSLEKSLPETYKLHPFWENPRAH